MKVKFFILAMVLGLAMAVSAQKAEDKTNKNGDGMNHPMMNDANQAQMSKNMQNMNANMVENCPMMNGNSSMMMNGNSSMMMQKNNNNKK